MRRLRERIQESNSLGVPRREDSSLGTIEGLLERGVATGDQIINALCSQKVVVLFMGGGGVGVFSCYHPGWKYKERFQSDVNIKSVLYYRLD